MEFFMSNGAPLTINVRDNGPLHIEGPITILDADQNPFHVAGEKPSVFLCRCGLSANKPFCDGSHKGVFTASERAKPKVP